MAIMADPLADETNRITRGSLRQSKLDGFSKASTSAQPLDASSSQLDTSSDALCSIFAHPSSSKRLRSSQHRCDSSDESDDDELRLLPSPIKTREQPSRRRRPDGLSLRASLGRGDLLKHRVAPPNQRRHVFGYVDQFDLAHTYVSHNERDVFYATSESAMRDFATPYSCAFSNGARGSGKRLLAVSDEEGSVTFLDVDAPETYSHGAYVYAEALTHAERLRATIKTHDNAVFDVKWSADDRLIATASGDQTVGITDVTTQQAIGRAVGHTCTVKQVAWDPFNPYMISTASRDGSIRIWDIRVPSEREPAACNVIRNAHGDGKNRKIKAGMRSSARSVTSVAYLQQREHLVASSGSADGVVKVWDVRRSHTKRVNPEPIAASVDLTTHGKGASRRPHGISSLCLSPDGVSLYALSTDSTVYSVEALGLELDEIDAPPKVWRAPIASEFSSTSFYVRISCSPDGRWLATGSTTGGGTYIWDAKDTTRAPVRLQGHRAEVSGVDWGRDALATCSDDNMIRLWRPDIYTSRLSSHDPLKAAVSGAVELDD